MDFEIAAKLLLHDQREGRVWAKPNRGVGGSATDQATLWGKSSTFDTECLCLLRFLVKALGGCGKGRTGIVEAGINEVGKLESVCMERNFLLGWMRQECEFDLL